MDLLVSAIDDTVVAVVVDIHPDSQRVDYFVHHCYDTFMPFIYYTSTYSNTITINNKPYSIIRCAAHALDVCNVNFLC